MTIQQILELVNPIKPMRRETLYVHLRRERIRPVSRVRQIPQQYPDDTADRILVRLGLKPSTKNGRTKR
jgi:hypothetical protein